MNNVHASDLSPVQSLFFPQSSKAGTTQEKCNVTTDEIMQSVRTVSSPEISSQESTPRSLNEGKSLLAVHPSDERIILSQASSEADSIASIKDGSVEIRQEETSKERASGRTFFSRLGGAIHLLLDIPRQVISGMARAFSGIQNWAMNLFSFMKPGVINSAAVAETSSKTVLGGDLADLQTRLRSKGISITDEDLQRAYKDSLEKDGNFIRNVNEQLDLLYIPDEQERSKILDRIISDPTGIGKPLAELGFNTLNESIEEGIKKRENICAEAATFLNDPNIQSQIRGVRLGQTPRVYQIPASAQNFDEINLPADLREGMKSELKTGFYYRQVLKSPETLQELRKIHAERKKNGQAAGEGYMNVLNEITKQKSGFTASKMQLEADFWRNDIQRIYDDQGNILLDTTELKYPDGKTQRPPKIDDLFDAILEKFSDDQAAAATLSTIFSFSYNQGFAMLALDNRIMGPRDTGELFGYESSENDAEKLIIAKGNSENGIISSNLFLHDGGGVTLAATQIYANNSDPYGLTNGFYYTNGQYHFDAKNERAEADGNAYYYVASDGK